MIATPQTDGTSALDDLYEYNGAGPPLVPKTAPEKVAKQTMLQKYLAKGKTLRQMMQVPLTALVYIVEGIIGEGLHLLAGRTKIGKTWICTHLALAVSTGGRAFGKINVDKGRVLFFSLEDGSRSIQRRFDNHIESEDEPIPENLHIFTEWPPGKQGVKLLGELLAHYEDTRLVIIDTLKAFSGPSKGSQNAYHADYECVQPLQALSKEFSVTILLTHHTNKAEWEDPFDAISGSMGLRGAVDNELVLIYDKTKTHSAILHVRGRNLEQREYAFAFDARSKTFLIQGETFEVAKTPERQVILDVIKASDKPLKLQEIITELDKKNYARSYTNVQKLTQSMANGSDPVITGDGRLGYSLNPIHLRGG